MRFSFAPSHSLREHSARIDVCMQHLVRESCALVTISLLPLVGSFRMPNFEITGESPALQIVVCSFQQFVVVVPALAFAPFGMPPTAFWIYVCASLLFIIGLIKIFSELRQEHGVDKIMPFGRLFFAIPMAVLVPSISPSRRVLRPWFHAGFPPIRFGSIWWASLFFARRSVLPFSSRHGWQRLWSE